MRANQNPVPLTSKNIKKTNCCYYCNGLNKYIYIQIHNAALADGPSECGHYLSSTWDILLLIYTLLTAYLFTIYTNAIAYTYTHAHIHTYASNITVCVCISMCVCLCNLMLLHLASTTNVSLGFDERFIWIVVYSYRYILIKIHMFARTKGVVLKWQYTIFLDSHTVTHKPPHTHIHVCVCALVRFGGKLHLKKVHIRKQNILALLSLSP